MDETGINKAMYNETDFYVKGKLYALELPLSLSRSGSVLDTLHGETDMPRKVPATETGSALKI